jgi:ketosteroid isomerase-like protein
MSLQSTMTAAERAAIEKEITEIYLKVLETSEKADVSYGFSLMSDAYHLGLIDDGSFFQFSEETLKQYQDGFALLERQKILEKLEFHIAVLKPDIVVLTALEKCAVYSKDGKVFTGNFAHTWIIIKINGEWKCIHSHQSAQKVE